MKNLGSFAGAQDDKMYGLAGFSGFKDKSAAAIGADYFFLVRTKFEINFWMTKFCRPAIAADFMFCSFDSFHTLPVFPRYWLSYKLKSRIIQLLVILIRRKKLSSFLLFWIPL